MFSFLLQVLEIMAFKADMRKIMLTCFKHNPAAQKFFKTALKYEIDETCPIDDVYEQNDYEVIFTDTTRKRKIYISAPDYRQTNNP